LTLAVIYAGYPNEAAVHIALGTVRKRLDELKQQKKVDNVIHYRLSLYICLMGNVLFSKIHHVLNTMHRFFHDNIMCDGAIGL